MFSKAKLRRARGVLLCEATGNCLGAVRLGVLHCCRKGELQGGRGVAFLQRRDEEARIYALLTASMVVDAKRNFPGQGLCFQALADASWGYSNVKPDDSEGKALYLDNQDAINTAIDEVAERGQPLVFANLSLPEHL